MKNNFFRKDLNLKNRWWHRFLFVVFIFSIVLYTIYNLALYSTSDMFRGGKAQQWEKVETLNDRLTSELNTINTLIKPGEKIAEDNRTYVLNDKIDEYYKHVLSDVYCSTKLVNNIEKIKNGTKIQNLFIRNKYGKNNVPLKDFTEYIKQNNIYCLSKDAYTKYGYNKQITGKLSFLEPDSTYQNNWSFYKKSTSKTVVYFLEMILSVLAFSSIIFVTIIIIYYKIILFIIYGNKNK